ncbi:PucR C-terminal helix-turn-helix domain-containing protein [Actinacidiphila yanglinensis]|uniref:PucR C-terminal helix-turn-helix domain-containing protein n=1 Tax=Actinacidiphila yanglinensis TaxID=310779 RepID=A0A1H5XIX2_9ACTN|nr:PucR family transcriptional regulator ligand-binding domain-containing protein [Actinacidiphila yanglinensis]SEG11405.1 PucR C-terminal helix-turn-helix domain-containing protein [Actinacidiphila yanglinensis]
MRLSTLRDTDALGLRLLGGENELDRTVRGVMTTDLRDPSRYLTGGELVLTGLAWRHGPEDSEPFVRLLSAAGVAALAAGEAGVGPIPQDLVDACARHRLPLFAVDERVAFATITEYVVRQVSGERAGDLAAVVDRHRRLMSAGPAGGGPDAVLDLLGSDLDLRAWVLSSTGREIGGAGQPLPAPVRAELAGAQQAASRTGRPAPYRATAQGGRTYSLFPVRTAPGADVRATVLSDWFLAVEADAGDWPAERLELLRGVTRLIGVERERRDAARAVRRRLATEVFELVRGGAAPSEIGARLRAATPVLLPGGGAPPQWQIVVARVDWDDAGPEAAPGPVARALLEELLAEPAEPGAEAADRVAVAVADDRAMALVPLVPPGRPAPARAGAPGAGSAGSDEDAPGAVQGPAAPSGVGGAADAPDSPESAGSPGSLGSGARADRPAGNGAPAGAEPVPLRADRLLAAVRGPLARGLGEDGRLTIGVSAAVHSPEGLRGALEEARHARRVAAARPGRVCVAGDDELASHVLLLPFVPDDVRRAFTARLLDPLHAYDRRHRAELIPTLEAFLDCDGSWTRCASRLHLHVNTLRYRIGRIEQLTGRDLARLEDKLDFFLALRMS